MSSAQRTIGVGLAAVAGLTMLSGCASPTHTTVPAATVPIGVPAASPPTTVVVPPVSSVTRVSYPHGAYELYGNGTTVPYYWVWVPAGVQAPMVPTPPPLPPAR